MKRLWLYPLLLISVQFAHADSTVILSTPTPRPGDTLRIEIDGVSPTRPISVTWNKTKYRFYGVGPSAQRALIGVKLGADAGSFPLHFETSPSTSETSALPADVIVEVATRTYETEDVVFPNEKTRIFNEELERREGARIHRILQQLHQGQYWEGRFDPPVNGAIEGVFGVKRLRNHTIDAGFHKGVDLKSPAGTPVKAANGGIVAFVHTFRIHGRVVIIDHGQGVMSIYLHMKGFNVKPGQEVSKGDVVGFVGSTGISTAPHVHWGIYVHGVPVDPAPWLEREF